MVSFTINEGKVEKLAVFGNFETTISEVVYILYVIYKAIEKSSAEAAKTFKKCIESAIKDGIVFADVDEREEIIEKIKKEKEKGLTEEIEQLLQELKRKK